MGPELHRTDSFDVSSDTDSVYDGVPKELCRNLRTVITFLIDARGGQLQVVRRAKLMVLGNEGVGKTTILDTLIEPLAPREMAFDGVHRWVWPRGRFLCVYDRTPAVTETPLETIDLQGATMSTLGELVLASGRVLALDPAALGEDVSAWTVYVTFHSVRTETLGVRARPWTLAGDPPIELKTWDFAGQAYYYDSHPFFLTSRAVYLVLWSIADTTRVATERLAFWLASLRRHALKPGVSTEPPMILLVGTHADDATVDRLPTLCDQRRQRAQALARKVLGLDQLPYFEVAAHNPDDAGIRALRSELLSALLRWAPLNQRLPAAYVHVLGSLTALRTRTNADPVTDVPSVLEACRADPAHRDLRADQVTTALTLFDAWGECIYFGERAPQVARSPSPHDRADDVPYVPLQQLVVLTPEWLTVAVVGALAKAGQPDDAGDVVVQHGVLRDADVPRVWPAWTEARRGTALRVLEQFGLCERLSEDDTRGPGWFVASALPATMPRTVPVWAARADGGDVDLAREVRLAALPTDACMALLRGLAALPSLGVNHLWRRGLAGEHSSADGLCGVRVEMAPEDAPVVRLWARGPPPAARAGLATLVDGLNSLATLAKIAVEAEDALCVVCERPVPDPFAGASHRWAAARR